MKYFKQAVAAATAVSPHAVNARADPFASGGICDQATLPTIDFAKARQPLFQPPQVYPDADGVTRVQMHYNLVNYIGPSYTTIIRAYDGIAPGRTIHVTPGGRLELELVNCLDFPLGFEAHNRFSAPNTTNIHTHGLHISGNNPGDNIFRTVEPQNSTLYMYDYNDNHMPGTFWYHAHKHGSTALQVGQGASGLIIMDHTADYPLPEAYLNMSEIQFVFQHINLPVLRAAANISGDLVTNWIDHNFEITNSSTEVMNLMLVNMQFLPVVKMEVNKWYKWRMVLSSMEQSLAFHSQTGNCEFKLLAKDGIYLQDAPRDVSTVILSPGNRADVAVRCHKIGLDPMNVTGIGLAPGCGLFDPEEQYDPSSQWGTNWNVARRKSNYTHLLPNLLSRHAAGTFYDPKLMPEVLIVEVVPSSVDNNTSIDNNTNTDILEPLNVPTPCYLVDLRSVNESQIATTWTNEFSCDPNPPWPDESSPENICGIFGPTGNGGGGGDELIPFTNDTTYLSEFSTGTVQEFDLRFSTFHVYHQHVNPFQIVKFHTKDESLVDEDVTDWYKVGDWQDTLQWPNRQDPPSHVSVRFQADLFTGHMIMHCHLLFHEDQGMMGQYKIVGEEGATWEGARQINPSCIEPTKRSTDSGIGVLNDTGTAVGILNDTDAADLDILPDVYGDPSSGSTASVRFIALYFAAVSLNYFCV